MLTLIDGNSLLFRAFYGVRGNLTRSDGTPTGAVYGFCNIILPLLASAKPDDIFICVFDASRKTFRNDIYPDYKGNRSDTPPDLLAQIELTRNAARAMGMPVLVINGVEADDVIATLATKNCAHGGGTRIVTSDKDLMQLVSPCTFIYDGMKEKEIRADGVLEKFGVRPDQVIDVQSLMGDSSDNVPGVPGIGPKKASELINQFGTLDAIYENISGVKNDRIRQLLKDHKEQAYISKQLVSLKTDVALPDFSMIPFKFDTAGACLFVKKELESNSLAAKMEKLFGVPKICDIAQGAQGDLFGGTSEQKSQTEIIKTPAHKIILTEIDLDTFLAGVKNVLAFDTETTGLDTMTAKIVGISLAADSNLGVYIPIRHIKRSDDLFETESVIPAQLSLEKVLSKLAVFFANKNIIKVAHNLKYDLHILENEGFDTSAISPIADTMLMSYILHGSLHSHGLDELAKLYLGHENISFNSLFDAKDKNKNFAELDFNLAAPYAAEDASICAALYEIFSKNLDKNPSLKNLYDTCDIPLLPVLLKMERNGVSVDRNKLKELSVVFHIELNRLEKEIWELSGHEFNIGSPKQLAAVLFEEMKLPSNKKRSTDAGTLNELLDSHPIIEKILEWRSMAKLAGTYADALPRQIAADGRIHTSYLQTSTNTGRLSSRDPNLQNIPTKTALGEKIKNCFIAKPGYVLISADFSQIQLRLLADVADVQTFKETFQNGADIHEQTARKIYGIAADVPVPKDLRRAAKTVNFSIIYGISSFGLSGQLGISRGDAGELINSYMDALPEIKKFMEDTKLFALENACVYTPMGRRIELPEIKNPRLRAYSLRAAVNAPIQGAEADIMRLAVINIDKKITNNNPDIKMIMQVHDEIVFECKAELADEYAGKIKFEMENVVKLSVPLTAEFTIDTKWGK